ncbi:lateral flagellin LafA [Pseudomonas songnenensis]|uniref:lateral flagellin LafA n=1 Tax=Pseudomonas songnenensis TaxID=1176259 RepID=UPI0028AB82BB|nr:lateral flagellin LafA [Pseudomonas songnenensis]
MALSIHTNYSSLITQTNLSKSNNALGTNQQRLGTGLRINSAADDAAGLQIATRLNAQSRGMGVAMRNTNDAVSMLQTAEGAFSEMTDILQRMKDLSTQAANATNSGADLIALQAEYDELGKEVANIVQNTKFAGSNLFSNGTTTDGSAGKFSAAMTFQIGASTAEKLTLDVSGKLTALATALGNASDTYTTPGTPGVELASTQVATTAVNSNASANITVVETALNAVGELRALFGANINRLNHTNNNLANMKDNTEMAKGRIMDADFASESANMTKNSMLMQSGISMLKQAGQMPGMVMGLLG